MAPEQPRHLGRRLQMAFGIGLQPPPGPVDGRALADTGQDVLQRAPPGVMIQHGIGRDHRCPGTLRHGRQPVNPCTVIAPPQGGHRQIEVVRPAPPPDRQPRLEGRVGPFRRGGQSDHPLTQRQRLFEGQPRLGFFDTDLLPTQWGGEGLALAQGQQAAQAAVSSAVAREDDQLGPVGETQPGPHDQREVDVLRPHQGPDHARQGIAVGHADGGQAEGFRLMHQLGGMRRPLQKAEIGHGPELGVVAVPAGHGSTPCIHQEGARSSGSPEYSRPYSPSRNSQ